MSKATDYALQCYDFDDSKLFATKQQLKEAEKTDYGKIKWDNFEMLVNRVRDEIDDYIEYIKTQPSKMKTVEQKKTVLATTRDIFKYCVYNMYTKELIGEYPTAESASLAMNLPRNTAFNSMEKRCGVYQKAGLIFTRTKIGERQVRPVKNEKPYIRAYNLSTNELIGTYSSVKNVALDLDISIKSVENSLYKRNGVYKKGNLKFVRENS